MRIFLLPISTRRALIYCQRLDRKSVGELTLVQKVINKVPQTWNKWEASGAGWKKSLTEYGNRGLRRIPYQEWGLKSFPPLSDHLQAEELGNNKKFEVVFPSNVTQEEDVPKIMRRLASERKLLHWRRFMGTLIGIPFTIPLGLIPLVPNIPFFYLAFRCYSHWRALKGSDHLEFIVDNRLFKPTSNPQIESIYNKISTTTPRSFTFVTRSQIAEGVDPGEFMLLQPGAHELVAQNLQVPELAAEVDRAVRQVNKSLKREAELSREQMGSSGKEQGQTRR